MTFEPTKPRGPIAAMYCSPGPCYALPSLMGNTSHDCRSTQPKAPAFQFGLRHKMYSTDSSPGPVYSLPPLNKTHKHALPEWTLASREFPPSQAKLNVPGPGAYDLRSSGKVVSESAPAYTFGSRARGRKSDNAPAPNNYSLPQIISQKHITRQSAPQFSMVGRSKVGGFDEDLKKTPGPCAYNLAEGTNSYKPKAAQYSISSRTYAPGDGTIKPGPGAHSVDKSLGSVVPREPAYSFGIRHSQYCAPIADMAEEE